MSHCKFQILNNGVGLTTGSDSELIMQILSQPPPSGEEKDGGPNWPARIRHLMSLTSTAYSLIMMYDDTIYAVRDPFGNRPLSIGVLVPPSGIKGVYFCQSCISHNQFLVSLTKHSIASIFSS